MDLLLHIDGARLANAAASLGTSLAAITTEAGADLLSFGGTKNGLMFGEAMVVLRPTSPRAPSSSASSSSNSTRRCAFAPRSSRRSSATTSGSRTPATPTRWPSVFGTPSPRSKASRSFIPLEANAVFARLDRPAIDDLLASADAAYPFYIWDEASNVVRWMCAWDTTSEDVDAFAEAVRSAVAAG